MTIEVIADAMNDMGLEYDCMERKSDPVYPYFTGEYSETPPVSEDGMQECTFILNGFSRDTWLSLEEAKNTIKEYFDRTNGRTVRTAEGHVVAVFYENSFPVPTGDKELKRIQINLTIKEWSVK